MTGYGFLRWKTSLHSEIVLDFSNRLEGPCCLHLLRLGKT